MVVVMKEVKEGGWERGREGNHKSRESRSNWLGSAAGVLELGAICGFEVESKKKGVGQHLKAPRIALIPHVCQLIYHPGL